MQTSVSLDTCSQTDRVICVQFCSDSAPKFNKTKKRARPMDLNSDSLTPDKIQALQSRLEAEQQRRKNENKLAYYRPYPKQMEFHAAGTTHRERLLMAGNQLGKTLAGGFELAMHATGRYPDWWQGKRFDGPIQAWACGTTGETCARYRAAGSRWPLWPTWNRCYPEGCARRAHISTRGCRSA
jgi:Terminase large subunit, T4likevirus-type, N-terminal